jgi:hypothetical protein
LKDSQGRVIYFQDKYIKALKFNENAISYFNREYIDFPEYDKQLISNVFDSLQDNGLYEKLYVLYIFASHADSAIHNLINDNYTVTFESGRKKPNWFKYSGIEGIYTNTDFLYANTNFNPNDDFIRGDSITYGVYIDDYANDVNGVQFGAYDLSSYFTTQIGRDDAVRFTFIHDLTNISNPITPKVSNSLISYSRINDSTKIYVDNQAIYRGVSVYSSAPDTLMYLAARNQNGVTTSPSQNTISIWYASDYLTDTELLKMNSILKYYMNSITAEDAIYENDYVQYKYNRGAGFNNFPVIWQDSNQVLCAAFDSVYMSLDGGNTFPYRGYLDSTINITSSFMMSNNNIIICNEGNSCYSSFDSLSTFNRIPIQNQDSTPYVFHTPINSLYPGSYFEILQDVEVFKDDGHEIAIIPQYANLAQGGASSVVLWYTADSGKTIKKLYEFGQNPNYTDNGTTTAGVGGNLLGDPSNSILARHIHHARWANDSLIWSTGDSDSECIWFSSKYNPTTDKWTTDSITSTLYVDRFKSTGLHVEGDTIYFGSDDNITALDRGVFKCHLSDIADTNKHIALIRDIPQVWNMVKNENNIIAFSGGLGLKISKDNGATWSPLVTLDNLAKNSFYLRAQKIDINGFITVADDRPANKQNYFGGSIKIKLK